MKMMSPLSRQYRLRIVGLLAIGVLGAGALFAQSPVPRIHSDVNASQMTVLQGSQHPLVTPENDAGRMPAATRLGGLTIAFSRTPAQKAEIDALIAAQQNPASPQYHKWLTPDQFAARFGLAQSDIDKVQAWLQQQGFSIDSVMRSRTGIRFSGTVGQVESAFQTQMHYYTAAGEKHFAPSTAISVPAALAGVVANVGNLNDFRPRPQHVISHRAFTSGATGNVFFAPGDIDTVYDIKALKQSGVDGTGQTIAIMGQSWIDIHDVEAFQTAAGLTVKDPQLVLVPGTGNDNTTSQGDESESDLDVEWSGAVAPGANVVFVYTGSDSNSGGVYTSIQYAIDNAIGNVISISYSTCETEFTIGTNGTFLTSMEQFFQQAATQGQTVVAASGDEGSTACYGDKSLTMAQQQAVAVNYPASSAYVTGIGGTEIPTADGVDPTNGTKGANYSTYWTSSSGSDVLNSAKQYIPEIAWNDDPLASPQLSASGGGTSALINRPSWQAGVPGIPSGTKRLVPDIAFYSSSALPGYLYCSSDTSVWQTGQTGSCTSGFRESSSNHLLTVAGGTSFATPIFAGMVALLNDSAKYASGSGEINSTLYTLAGNSATYATVFHDVTSGNNNCTAASTTCAATTGFSAGTGYDEVTGLGSIDVNALATVWPAPSTILIGTSVAVQPANSPIDPNTNDVVTISVKDSNGNAVTTGTVTLQIDGGKAWGATGGTTLTNQALDANGQLTYTANFTTPGTHQILAQYVPDATHAGSTGIAEIVINGSTSKGSIALSLTPSTLSVSRGSSGNETLTVTPSGGYTGTVSLSYSTSDQTALANLCVFAQSGFDANGNIAVTGTSPVSGTIQIDTNASDCASTTGAKVGAHGMRILPRGGSAHAANRKSTSSLPGGLAFAGLLLAGLLGRSSRKLRGLACVIALVAVAFGMSACSSSSGGSSSGPSNPPKGTYTITFAGTDTVTSSITAQSSFTLTIQ